MPKATINDVAELAGVSIKTVSRVVNNEPNVRQATREKVEQAVAALDYRPNPLARGLAGNRSYLIALIFGAPGAHYVLDVQGGILDVCRPFGYELVVHPAVNDDPNLLDDVRTLARERRVDAVLLTPPISDNLEVINALISLQVPFVRLAPTLDKHLSPYVETNDVEAAFDITQSLIALGHREIGFVRGNPAHRAVAMRFDGYVQALASENIALNESLIVQGDNHFQAGVEAAATLLTLASPPTAIFAANDDMAAGVIMEAHQRGIAVPSELSVVGFDDSPVARQLWPALTTVRQPILEMARKATELLINGLRGVKVASPGVVLPSRQIQRKSIAAKFSAPDTGVSKSTRA